VIGGRRARPGPPPRRRSRRTVIILSDGCGYRRSAPSKTGLIISPGWIVVPDYRLYPLRDGGGTSGELISAETAIKAIKQVFDRTEPAGYELWLGERRVAIIRTGTGEPQFPTGQ
jgi:hypothetical protein